MKHRTIALCLIICLALNACETGVTCVEEGTLIRTPDGERPIELLRVGDQVVGQTPEGALCIGRVTAVHEGVTRELVELKASDGRVVGVTPEHPVLVGTAWQRACDIAAGAIVHLDGPNAVTFVSRNAVTARVFDLSVEPHQTYFANGFLVHNKTVARPVRAEDVVGTWIGRHPTFQNLYAFRLDPDGSGAGAFMQTGTAKALRLDGWVLENESGRPATMQIRFYRPFYNGDQLVDGLVVALVDASHEFLDITFVEHGRMEGPARFWRAAELAAEVEGLRGVLGSVVE